MHRIEMQYWLWEAHSFIVGLAKGRYPRIVSKVIIRQKTRNPLTLNEKILFRMQSDRNPRLQIFGSKIRTRRFLQAAELGQYLPRLIWAGTDLLELSRKIDTENDFVLKPDCGSGATIIFSDLLRNVTPKDIKLFDNPWGLFVYTSENTDTTKILQTCEMWQKKHYGFRKNTYPEWAYQKRSSLILMEELLITSDGQLPRDYKLFVFGGRCHLIQVDYDRFFSHTRAFYSRDWERLNISCIYPQFEFDETKPRLLEQMILISERIAQGIDFLRVDLYITNSGIKIGECTVYPGGGIDQFDPREINLKYGALWIQSY
jgi:hypothetical protein